MSTPESNKITAAVIWFWLAIVGAAVSAVLMGVQP